MSKVARVWQTFRRRPLRNLMLTFVALVAVGLLVNAFMVWSSGVALQAELGRIKASGAPISLAELALPPVPDDENGAAMLRSSKPEIDALYSQLRPILESPEFQRDAMTAEQVETVRQAFAEHHPLLETITRASRAPHFDSRNDYSQGPSAAIEQVLEISNSQRAPQRLLSVRVRQLLADGEEEAAMQTALTMLRFSRQCGSESHMLVQGLVAIALQGSAVESLNRVLRSVEVSAELRKELDAELARHDSSAAIVQCLQGERVIGLANYDEIIPWQRNWLMRAYGNRDKQVYLSFMQTAIDNAERPVAERMRMSADPKHPLPSLLVPPLEAYQAAHLRSLALLRCLRVLNAMQAGDKLNEPEIDFAALSLPEPATIDPYDGQTLRLMQTPNGPIIYSVGVNANDDDANFDRLLDVGIAPLEH